MKMPTSDPDLLEKMYVPKSKVEVELLDEDGAEKDSIQEDTTNVDQREKKRKKRRKKKKKKNAEEVQVEGCDDQSSGFRLMTLSGPMGFSGDMRDLEERFRNRGVGGTIVHSSGNVPQSLLDAVEKCKNEEDQNNLNQKKKKKKKKGKKTSTDMSVQEVVTGAAQEVQFEEEGWSEEEEERGWSEDEGEELNPLVPSELGKAWKKLLLIIDCGVEIEWWQNAFIMPPSSLKQIEDLEKDIGYSFGEYKYLLLLTDCVMWVAILNEDENQYLNPDDGTLTNQPINFDFNVSGVQKYPLCPTIMELFEEMSAEFKSYCHSQKWIPMSNDIEDEDDDDRMIIYDTLTGAVVSVDTLAGPSFDDRKVIASSLSAYMLDLEEKLSNSFDIYFE